MVLLEYMFSSNVALIITAFNLSNKLQASEDSRITIERV